jgi:hypothetical protein
MHIQPEESRTTWRHHTTSILVRCLQPSAAMNKARTIVTLGACLAGCPAVALADELNPEPCATDVVAALAGQGQWIVAQDGNPAWQPSLAVVGDDFVPYQTGGEWVDRDGVRVFVSQWPWGDLVFNEGSWIFDPDAGWLWLPDPTCVQMARTPMLDTGLPMVLPVLLLPAAERTPHRPFGPPVVHPSGRGRHGPLPTGGRGTGPRRGRPGTGVSGRSATGTRFPANHHRQP